MTCAAKSVAVNVAFLASLAALLWLIVMICQCPLYDYSIIIDGPCHCRHLVWSSRHWLVRLRLGCREWWRGCRVRPVSGPVTRVTYCDMGRRFVLRSDFLEKSWRGGPIRFPYRVYLGRTISAVRFLTYFGQLFPENHISGAYSRNRYSWTFVVGIPWYTGIVQYSGKLNKYSPSLSNHHVRRSTIDAIALLSVFTNLTMTRLTRLTASPFGLTPPVVSHSCRPMQQNVVKQGWNSRCKCQRWPKTASTWVNSSQTAVHGIPRRDTACHQDRHRQARSTNSNNNFYLIKCCNYTNTILYIRISYDNSLFNIPIYIH